MHLAGLTWLPLAIAIMPIGCSAPVAESPIELMAVEVQPASYSKAIIGTTTGETSHSAPNGIESEASEATTESKELAIPDGMNFFTPQRSTAMAVEVTRDDDKQQTVRLVGLVNASEQPDESAIALIRIEDELLPIRVGESSHDITLLSLDPKNRTATIQHQRQRLTLVMMNQPIENAPSTAPRARLFPKSEINPSRSAKTSNEFPTPVIQIPESEPLLPPFEDESPIAIPKGLDLPVLPDLPGLEEFKDAF